ncbi:MAG: thermonuclease family protein [Bradymonadales bacterium]|nr:thermonuclease family protein [Bradymonadales bacterium]
MNPRNRVVVGAILLVLSLYQGIWGCSTAPPASRSSQELDRLRERMAESESAPTTAQQPTRTTPPVPVEQSLLLPFRYYGGLPDDDPRVLGVFRLRTHRDPIVDGDTIAVYGLDASLRLVGIDSEEIFHGNEELRLRAYADFEGYLRTMYEGANRFPKFGTPTGELAREFARQFFSGHTEVRLEYDEVFRTQGYFGRYLVYVFILHQGQWVNYNLEAVRAGMTPYFQKYGNSQRFHREFLEAQQEAQDERRGIWDPSLRHYPDYPERLVWWERRGRAIDHFELLYGEDPTYINLSNDDDWERLADLEGQTITVFATIADYHYDWTPARILLSHRVTDDFALISFDASDFEPFHFEQYEGEYLYVRGTLRFYEGKPQMYVNRHLEVWIEP